MMTSQDKLGYWRLRLYINPVRSAAFLSVYFRNCAYLALPHWMRPPYGESIIGYHPYKTKWDITKERRSLNAIVTWLVLLHDPSCNALPAWYMLLTWESFEQSIIKSFRRVHVLLATSLVRFLSRVASCTTLYSVVVVVTCILLSVLK